MGLFEYLFERKNPGKVGSFKRNDQPAEPVSIPVLVLKILISGLMIYGLFYMTVLYNVSFMKIAAFIVILLIYCFISYKVIPQPDTSNVGLLGGLIDHPFRYTDDLNRILIVFLILLYPGRFISTTAIQTTLLLKRIGKR
jgi:hypothetical protein